MMFKEPQEVIKEIMEGNRMHYKTAAQFLGEYKYISVRVKAYQERYEVAETMATHCTAMITGLPGGGSGNDKMATAVERITESKDRLADKIIELEDLEKVIVKTIDQVEDVRYRTLLELHYLNCYTLERTAEEMNYSDHIKVLHAEALSAVDAIMKAS